jgi:hypothetical protein
VTKHALGASPAWPTCHQRRPAAEGEVKPGRPADNTEAESLAQLIVRSTRDIEAHASRIGLQLTSRYFIGQAAQFLAALRLWAQSHSQSDHHIRSMLDNLDIPVLRDAAYQLREMAAADAKAASWTIELNTTRASRELLTIAVIAIAALD